MPWTCPACRTRVQHTSELPQPDRVYRCPVCRLDMLYDTLTGKMRPIPPNGDDGNSDDKAREVA
jgi:DNA-directed RNA polymerase subunit RPC12/RpoP